MILGQEAPSFTKQNSQKKVYLYRSTRPGVGLVWAQPPWLTCTLGATIHKSLLNFRANLKNLARTSTFAGAVPNDISPC